MTAGPPVPGARRRSGPRPRPDPAAEDPGERVRRAAGDAQPAAVDAAEVVEGAEADEVLRLVAAAVRPELDVVRVRRAPAAPRHLAEAPVPDPHVARASPPRLGEPPPGLDEVPRDDREAPSRGNGAVRPLPDGVDGRGEEDGDPPGHRDRELAPCTHLPLGLPVQRPTELDAGERVRARDP